jgi:hypothetical protein
LSAATFALDCDSENPGKFRVRPDFVTLDWVRLALSRSPESGIAVSTAEKILSREKRKMWMRFSQRAHILWYVCQGTLKHLTVENRNSYTIPDVVPPPTLKNFLSSFGGQWFTRMSGPLTVPFAAAAFYVPQTWLKGLFAALAIVCALVSSYGVWSQERKARILLEKRVQELEFPPDRPKLSFKSWGQVRPEFLSTGAKTSSLLQHGFYLANDGGAALEVTVKEFSVGSRFAYGSTIARIEGGAVGFSPIMIKNELMGRHALDIALGIAWAEKVNSNEVQYVDPLVILVSVDYRDFNDVWYRTSSELVSHYRPGTTEGWIEFTAPKQESLGTRPPAESRTS